MQIPLRQLEDEYNAKWYAVLYILNGAKEKIAYKYTGEKTYKVSKAGYSRERNVWDEWRWRLVWSECDFI